LPYAAVALAACAWGSWGLIIRHAESIGPLPTALESAMTMAVTTAVAGAMSLRGRSARRRSWRAWACVGWFGVADMVNTVLFFGAYKLTIAVAVLTHYMAPVFVAVTAPFALREKMTARTGLSIAVSLTGLAVMLARSVGTAGSAVVWASAALGTGSAFFYASNVIVNKFVVDSFTASEAMFWHGVVATVLAIFLVPPGAWPTVAPRSAAFFAVASIGPGALAGLGFIWGLRRIPAAHAATLSLLEPLVSVLIGAGVLGEPVGARTAVGGALILAGAVAVMTQR
jgi:drug/metabolite transporter (DMT)-like permease